MRNFWKEKANKGLELFLSEAVAADTRFSHAQKEIPQVRASLEQDSGPVHQAKNRLFEYAQIPTDSRRYQREEI